MQKDSLWTLFHAPFQLFIIVASPPQTINVNQIKPKPNLTFSMFIPSNMFFKFPLFSEILHNNFVYFMVTLKAER